MTKSRGILAPRVRWTDAMDAALKEAYPNQRAETVAAALGVTVQNVYGRANRLGLKKSAEFLASPDAGRLRKGDSRGASTRFQVGQSSWNKGAAFAPGGRSVETQFKPGHRGGKAAQLYQPIGTERVTKDGYLERKINDDMPLQKRWRGVHLLNWEAENGPLPAGHALTFKDGNKQNCALDNLELLSRADLMRRNTRHNLPPELNEVIQLRSLLTRTINKRSKSDER